MKEALFLEVWLRRQEQDVNRMKLIAQGLYDAAPGESKIMEQFKQYVSSVFPFFKDAQASTDKQMIEAMKKEVEKGPIRFNAIDDSPLRRRAMKLSAPDEYRQKLAQGSLQRARRRG